MVNGFVNNELFSFAGGIRGALKGRGSLTSIASDTGVFDSGYGSGSATTNGSDDSFDELLITTKQPGRCSVRFVWYLITPLCEIRGR